MSARLPSMTALLGLLAVAGYQNRDKLADLLKGSAGSAGQGAQSTLGSIIGDISGALSGAGAGGFLNGGLGELLSKFQDSGHGETARSWIANGPNQEISPPDLKRAIGPDVLATLEQQTGLSQTELLARLSRELPQAVDKYTPDGELPRQ